MIVILGSGVAGASLAWALTRRGAQNVVVLDPLPKEAASTERATGGFRTQFENPLNIQLSLASLPVFAALGERIRWRQTGYLFTASDPETAAALAHRAEIQRACGLPITHPNLRAVVPFLQAPDVIATNFCALDGVYDPPSVRAAFIAEAQAGGAVFRFGEAFDAWVDHATTIVIACGIWSPEVGVALGVDLAITPVEHGVFLVSPAFPVPRMLPLMIDASAGWVFRERDGHLLVVTAGPPDDWDCVRAWLAERMPTARVTQPERRWTGFYEVTLDHHPLVGRTAAADIWASCGFSGHGVMHAPAIADSLAAMILGESPPLDLSPLSPLRTAPLIDCTQV